MDMTAAFDQLQANVNADPAVVRKARRRRDVFIQALSAESDIMYVFPSGSLARGSQIEPIHDVDLVAVFDGGEHGEWGQPGPSAGDALSILQARVVALLGSDGTAGEEVRLTRIQNHAVKCWLDDPDADEAFTVDVAPALEVRTSVVSIPEQESEDWVETSPQTLIRLVADRHGRWPRFVPLVRVLKRWNREHKAPFKSLTMEVLALEILPEGTRPSALARFFASAVTRVEAPIEDPAQLCGEIQPDLDKTAARDELAHAAQVSWDALQAESAGDTRLAQCLWRSVLGNVFPEPEEGCEEKPSLAPAIGVFSTPRPVRDAPQGADL